MKKRLSTLIFTTLLFLSIVGQDSYSDNFQINDSCELIVPKTCRRDQNWNMLTYCKFEKFELAVFSGFGQLMFKADSLSDEGFRLIYGPSKTSKGKPIDNRLPTGKYFWQILIVTSDKKEHAFKGNLKIE